MSAASPQTTPSDCVNLAENRTQQTYTNCLTVKSVLQKTDLKVYFCNFFNQRKHTPWGKVREWKDRPWVGRVTTAPGVARPA